MSEIVTAEMSVEEARHLTDDIKTAVAMTWDLIQHAYVGRAWIALGYSSWDLYCDQEFGTSRLRLPREERSDVVGSLRDAGLSVRAIAAATGESKSTIGRELAGVPNGTGETIVGTDGKSYPATRSEADPWYSAMEGFLDEANKAMAGADQLAADDKPTEALHIYKELADLGLSAQNMAARRTLNAERLAGQILAGVDATS